MTKAAAEAAIKTPRAFALQAHLEGRALQANAAAVAGSAAGVWGGEVGEWGGDEGGKWGGEVEWGGGGSHEAAVLALPANWEALMDDATGKEYYFNTESRKVSWETPTG